MPAMRAWLAAACAPVACAQHLFWPYARLQAEVEIEAANAAPEPEVDVPEGFTNPKLCDPSVNQTAGYLSAGFATKYFFWLFESKSEPSTDPLIMWLSGGPGCSSQLALFFENGPCKVSKDGKSTTPNPHSWHSKANVMWVDQPAGVGFSTSIGTHDEAGVAANMLEFLQNFYKQFPQYSKNEFYIFGESYAGHYVPAIAHRVWQANKAGDGIKIPMAGIAIGNGLTDPEEQYKWYPEMGTTGGKSEGGHAPSGVINSKEGMIMSAMVPVCVLGIEACNSGAGGLNRTACMAAYEACNLMSQIPYEATGRNPYDMRIPCEHGRLCYDMSNIETYLNQPEVQQQIGVNKRWGSCNMAVNLLFVEAGDWMVNYQGMIPDLLADGIKALIYAGDVDYICNWLGNMKWTQKLEWPHKADFNAVTNQDYKLDGETVAKIRTSHNFSFMQVFNAGHMVPMDQPTVSLQMVKDFTTGSLEAHAAATELVV